jgi:hypothetical protein
MGRWLRRIALIFGAVALALLAVAVGARVALARPRPDGEAGPAAEALADRIAAAVDLEAWGRTGAVRWTLFGHTYLWDRQRDLVRYEDGKGVVLTEGWRPMGRAFRDGQQVGGDWKDRRVQLAYESFVNDAFWAFAPTKIRDPGTSRAAVGQDLLVSYGSGGVTPGDAYLWELGPDGKPVAWRVWARVLPLPGARFSWEDWVRFDTGAWVALTRRSGPLTLRLTDVAGAATLAELAPGEDPFAPMYGP